MRTKDRPSALAASDPSIDQPTLLAMQRLASSRQRLQMILMPPPRPAPAGGGFGLSGLAQLVRAQWQHWRASMHGWPLLDLAGDGLQRWWRGHPWRPVGEVLGGEVGHWLRAAVRRHPLASAALAATAGVVLVSGRAWRWPWLRRPAHRVPQMAGRWLQRQIAQPAVMTMLAGMVLQSIQRKLGPEATEGQVCGPSTATRSDADASELRRSYGGEAPAQGGPAAAPTFTRDRSR